MTEVEDLSLVELVKAVKTGQVKSRHLIDQTLRRARQTVDLNPFIEFYASKAEAQADLIDKKIKDKKPVGRLAGIPFAVKDNILIKGTQTTAAAPFLKDFIAPYTSTAVLKILKEDAILVGKTNLDAFGHGGSTENTAYGPTKNPIDETKVPGGSSGGSAVAVATDICKFAFGTDTGGSIRQPASFCGVFGYKPSYGLLSRYGVVAMASSTDCVGFLTKSATDSADLAELAAGKDRYDSTTFDSTSMNFQMKSSLDKLKIGKIDQLWENLEDGVAQPLADACQKIEATNQLSAVSIPSLDLALACYYILVPAEISSNLSRYDGLRYGQQQAGDDYQQIIDRSRGLGFLAENKRRIMLGSYVLSSGYYDAYYRQAQKLRHRLIDEFNQAFERCDFLISPVSPITAFGIGETTDPLKMYQSDLMTVGVSLAGLPAVSLPIKLDSNQPAVGLQIIGPYKSDDKLLACAKLIESVVGSKYKK